jgi:hypothetical protein
MQIDDLKIYGIAIKANHLAATKDGDFYVIHFENGDTITLPDSFFHKLFQITDTTQCK